MKKEVLIYYTQEKNSKTKYVLVKDINTLRYYNTLHHGRKDFYCFCLQSFSTEEILKPHIKNFFKINGR